MATATVPPEFDDLVDRWLLPEVRAFLRHDAAVRMRQAIEHQDEVAGRRLRRLAQELRWAAKRANGYADQIVNGLRADLQRGGE